jgi:hypothetical protein
MSSSFLTPPLPAYISEVDILVVTPTLGKRSQVTRTIQSVASIGGSRVFHCIVGPTKYTKWIKESHPNVYLLDDEGCHSIYEALNLAVFSLASKFKYFAYINDDDYWESGFSQLIRLLDTFPNLTLVYGRTRVVDLLGNFIKMIPHFPFPWCFRSLLKFLAVMFTQQSVLCRTSDLIELKAFDQSYRLYADSDLFARWIESGRRVGSCSAICSSYCYEGQRLSNNTLDVIADLRMLRLNHGRVILPQDLLIFLIFRCYNTLEYSTRILKYLLPS